MKDIINTFFGQLLLSPKWRIVRHLMLQIPLILMALSVFGSKGEEVFDFRIEELPTFIFIYIFFNISVYINIYFLTPRYFYRGRILRFILSVLALVLLYLVCVAIVLPMFNLNTAPPSINSEPHADSTQITNIQQDNNDSQQSAAPTFDTDKIQNGDVRSASGAPDGGMFFNVIGLVTCVAILMFIIIFPTCLLLFRKTAEQNVRNSELRSATAQTELKMLKQQINPHFLFNMINNVNVLVQRNPQEASELLFRLEDLLRYQFADSDRESVKLISDIQFLRDFLNLEKTRRTNFRYDIRTENIDNEQITPPLLFIPFVENAVKHNTDGENESWIEISFAITGNTLKFSCINSKPPYMPATTKVGGLGLQNIKRRLELLYPGTHTLEINDDEKEFRVFLTINLN